MSRANGRLPSIGVMPGGAVRTVLSRKPHGNRVSWRGGVRRGGFESTRGSLFDHAIFPDKERG
eukprot:6353374-Prymnesium_polylepis.1